MKSSKQILLSAAISLTLTSAALAKNKVKAPAKTDQDQIKVEGHLQLPGGQITGFVATEHYGRAYVYAERAAGGGFVVIDVTQPAQPKLVNAIPTVGSASGGGLLAVAGTAALVGAPAQAGPAQAPPQTIEVLDLSDPALPKIAQRFEGVTAVERVQSRGLILLANPDGVWVLSEHLAQDPAVEERYARKVFYGESMY